MFRANIFQKNIPSNVHKESVELVLSFNHSLVEITSKEILIKNDTGGHHKYDLDFFEKDMYTTTHIGKFENGIPFRLIQPHGNSLEMVKSKHNSKGAFSFGSLNPDGFAIHFLLTDSNEIRNEVISDKGDAEQIQRLIEGAFMSLQFGLQNKFIEVTKRLLLLIKSNPTMIKNYKDGNRLAQRMKENLYDYNSDEKGIIKRM